MLATVAAIALYSWQLTPMPGEKITMGWELLWLGGEMGASGRQVLIGSSRVLRL